MGLTSCSPPISAVNPTVLRRVSAFLSHPCFQKHIPFSPTTNCAASCSSSTSDYFGGSLSLPRESSRRNHPDSLKKSRRSFFVVSGIFEKFTERAIKAVMFSQREAKALGKDMVFTQHLLLGLVAEGRASGGFLGFGITVEAVREAVRSLWQEDEGNRGRTEDVSSHNLVA